MKISIEIKDEEKAQELMEAFKQFEGVEEVEVVGKDLDELEDLLIDVGEKLWRLADTSNPSCPVWDLVDKIQKELELDFRGIYKSQHDIVRAGAAPDNGADLNIWLDEGETKSAVQGVVQLLKGVKKVG